MNHDTTPHSQIWELIPWVANGTATPAQQQRVQEHLRDCSDCRDEYAQQCRFLAGMQLDDDAPPAAEPALRRLMQRIDAAEPAILPAPSAPARLAARAVPWLAAAVVVQAIGLALLGSALVQRPPATRADYVTLSQAPASERAAVRLVAAPEMDLASLRRVLGETGLHIVQSNADNSIFGLAPARTAPAVDVAEAIARLRREPGVLLAEPAAGTAALH
ncbi:putative zinc finger protein [Tahibacter aquaticus]|uniref:Putative zinc finger protein n=1 Tax=Tahibacter aquaticus TaxID=520092 RepID=A0A4R6Z745_9GAMM|nr:zf-HC2 domain-containing protein [Tahibacter aquaticus]TDR47601.1 putative zinc finger protein [Tahibacter aquaticus]